MDIHELRWQGPDLCPQDACKRRLSAKLPFVLRVSREVKIGDCLMFPDFFVTYPVIRYATPSDQPPPPKGNNHMSVVCAEPPDEVDEYEQMRDDALAQYKRQFATGVAA